jgi:hypothetical protein
MRLVDDVVHPQFGHSWVQGAGGQHPNDRREFRPGAPRARRMKVIIAKSLGL